MGIRVKLSPVGTILAKRHLDDEGQKYFSKKCNEFMNPYTPYLTGNLKDVEISVEEKKIVYKAPYAKKQFYTNAGMGYEGEAYGGPRGKQWCERMKADRMSDLTKDIAEYVGGKVKK